MWDDLPNCGLVFLVDIQQTLADHHEVREIGSDAQVRHSFKDRCCRVGAEEGCVAVSLMAHFAGQSELGIDVESAAVELDCLVYSPSLTILISHWIFCSGAMLGSPSGVGIDFVRLQGLGDFQLGLVVGQKVLGGGACRAGTCVARPLCMNSGTRSA